MTPGLRLSAGLLAGVLASGGGWAAEDPCLAVQPVLSEQRTKKAFEPLAEFISQITGQPCHVHTRPNFLSYWTGAYKGEYPFVLDAAHFTDYRIQKLGYTVLAKIPDTVSYSLVVPGDTLIFEPSELIGKLVAALGPPSIGAARMAQMFPNSLRQPVLVEVPTAGEGIRQLLAGEVAGALIPTPMVGQQMRAWANLHVVTPTPPVPPIALSVSPQVDAAVRARLKRALVNAHNTPDGRRMLEGIGFPRFDPADATTYKGQAQVLEETWGY